MFYIQQKSQFRANCGGVRKALGTACGPAPRRSATQRVYRPATIQAGTREPYSPCLKM
jgi:hypothetical protein